MANNHHHRILTRGDFLSPWSLPFFRDRRVKKVVIGCAICHPKKRIAIRKTARTFTLEDEPKGRK